MTESELHHTASSDADARHRKIQDNYPFGEKF
jgi:hypothetical protein